MRNMVRNILLIILISVSMNTFAQHTGNAMGGCKDYWENLELNVKIFQNKYSKKDIKDVVRDRVEGERILKDLEQMAKPDIYYKLFLVDIRWLYADYRETTPGIQNFVNGTFEIIYQTAKLYDNPHMQSYLADCYAFGYGCQKDATEALYWYRKAAENGCCHAMYKLCTYYMYGKDGVAKDFTKAKYWRDKAVSAGYQPWDDFDD